MYFAGRVRDTQTIVTPINMVPQRVPAAKK